jgi:hypothetical protein
MTDFVIVIATAAMLAAPMPAPSDTAAGPSTAASSIPLNAPTVGFRTYSDTAACEQATIAMVAPLGSRLVCLPVESGEMPNAY